MAPAPAWKCIGRDMPENDAAIILKCMKAYKVTTNNTKPCTVCFSVLPHTMQYILLVCSCSLCKTAAPYATCPWRGKKLVCNERNLVSVFEANNHVTHANPPRSQDFTPVQRAFAAQLTLQGLKPAKIRNAMLGTFDLNPQDLPVLSKVQNFVAHFRRTKMGGNDRLRELQETVHASTFSGEEADHAPFMFGWDQDDDGLLKVGNGSDEDPFLVGVTTKAMLRRANRDSAGLLLHIDATYKLNQVGYPVFVIGISDAARTFHLVAIFVSSQQQQEHYAKALSALRWVFFQVTDTQLQPGFVMGDADDAQYNAVQEVFGDDSRYQYLMCFYHLVAKVVEKTQGLRRDVVNRVMELVYDIHTSLDAEQSMKRMELARREWASSGDLKSFGVYFNKQWMTGKFKNWQCYLTPRGYATTNNPVEQFNKVLKRDFTMHQKLKMGLLLGQLMQCCGVSSGSGQRFDVKNTPKPTLLKRTKELRRNNLIHEVKIARNSMMFLLLNVADNNINIHSTAPVREFVPALNKNQEMIEVSGQLGRHKARLEVHRQPNHSWPVDMTAQTCGCTYFFKYGAACTSFLLYKSKLRSTPLEKKSWSTERRRKSGAMSAGKSRQQQGGRLALDQPLKEISGT